MPSPGRQHRDLRLEQAPADAAVPRHSQGILHRSSANAQGAAPRKQPEAEPRKLASPQVPRTRSDGPPSCRPSSTTILAKLMLGLESPCLCLAPTRTGATATDSTEARPSTRCAILYLQALSRAPAYFNRHTDHHRQSEEEDGGQGEACGGHAHPNGRVKTELACGPNHVLRCFECRQNFVARLFEPSLRAKCRRMKEVRNSGVARDATLEGERAF